MMFRSLSNAYFFKFVLVFGIVGVSWSRKLSALMGVRHLDYIHRVNPCSEFLDETRLRNTTGFSITGDLMYVKNSDYIWTANGNVIESTDRVPICISIKRPNEPWGVECVNDGRIILQDSTKVKELLSFNEVENEELVKTVMMQDVLATKCKKKRKLPEFKKKEVSELKVVPETETKVFFDIIASWILVMGGIILISSFSARTFIDLVL